MSLFPLRAALRFAAITAAFLLLPAAANAATWTVDDDGEQCANATFSSIQTAVDFAAPHDTIIICDGVYQEKSTPFNGTTSPAQAGSRNGLTITKPLTIKGAGASKVFIEPDPSLGDSLAGTVPYLRDGGGNVVTISRQSLGASDDNENTVDISGVTIRSPYTYAEAGVAYFNTSGTIAKSTIGPLRRANADETTSRPYGWGVIMTNYLQGAGGGSGTVRRQVSVVDSLVTGYQAGGVLFDGARGADGTPESQARAGITEYGYVSGSKIVGGGNNAALAQIGVKYFAGVRGAVTGSTIQDNAAFSTTPTVYNSYGIFLSDSENGNDPDNPSVRAMLINGNAFLNNRYGLYNADLAGTAVRLGAPVAAGDNYWGCSLGPVVGTSITSNSSASYGCQGISGNDAAVTPAPSVELPSFRSAVPATLKVPASTPDAPPTAHFVDPVGLTELSVGDLLEPVVVATDDFGVKSVTLSADGVPVATIKKAPYEFEWTPAAADAGKTIVLTATAIDSSGQAGTDTVSVHVAPLPPVLSPPVNTALPVIVGDVTVGATIGCLAGSWNESPTAFSWQWLIDGSPVGGATDPTYTPVAGDAGAALTCAVTATNADGSATATSTSRTVVAAPVTDAPTNTALPVIFGDATPGQTVACLPGSWTGSPTSFTYQWLLAGTPIGGETDSTYELAAGDAASSLSCAVTATNAGGDATATSTGKLVKTPAAPQAPSSIAPPVIVGDAVTGQTVVCLTGTWNASPTGFTYKWLLGGSEIGGATSSTYTPAAADAGATLTCAVTATNGDGSATATSSGRAVTLPPEPPVKTIERQLGTVVLSLNRPLRVSTKTGKLVLGEATCVKAADSVCKITVTATVKISGKSYKLTAATFAGDGAKQLVLTLPSAARKALAKSPGTIAYSITAGDDSGTYGSWKQSVSIKKK